MDRELAAAVIATFRATDAPHHRQTLRAFAAHRWKHNFHWLDASGLALYFLQKLRTLEIKDAVPESVLSQLERRQADNEQRTASLFDEFVRLNTALTGGGLPYANLKGFTYIPDYCPNPSLRYQMDCDFLIEERDATRCCDILRSLGYSVVAANRHVIELKTGGPDTPRISDLYKTTSQRVVELHLCDDSRPDRHSSLLQHRQLLQIRGGKYPALSAEEIFLAQTCHLFRHLRSEWTRISWLLELRHFVAARRDDAPFWRAVRLRADHDEQGALAVGASLRLAQNAFGHFACDELTNWSVEQLPAAVALWIERYGDEVLLADFPGSKLYLILEQALCDGHQTRFMIRRRLFPRRAPANFVASPSGGPMQKLKAAWVSYRYFFFRMRFHIVAGSQYFVESWRWKRLRKCLSTKNAYHSADSAASAAD
jgi:hypothetical protein